jgi:DNA-binding NarL/FixJ family response regulator/signal transduction histidine kinase
MPRALPIHLLAMLVQVGVTAYAIWALGPALPASVRALLIGLLVVFIAAWAGVIVAWSLWRRVDGRRLTWRRANWAITWLGNGANIAGFWIVAPYSPDTLILLLAAFAYATVTVQVLGSIQRPPAVEGWVLAPLAMPASLALYAATHFDRYSAPLIPYSAAYAVVMLEVRRVVQRAVNQAHGAQATAEAALAEAAAERDAKTRFLTSASHDLGQPLQAARLFFDQAMRGRTAAQRAAAAAKVSWAFDATEQLLTQMLDHLRLESGAVAPHMGEVALGPLIARIAELNEPAARLAGAELVAMPSRLRAAADAALTERALGNLVGNAIRHAKARRVLIGARRTGGRLRVWVIDDGVGVAEADAERLFDDFVQGSDHGDQIRGGFGLGLASARRMAGLMGGAVGLERKWRGGSAFWLELGPADGEAAARGVRTCGRGRWVGCVRMKSCLICDDHAMMREALAGAVALGWPAAEITQAADFPQAWAAASRGPELIISDLVMPGAGPVDGVRRLREAAPASPILVVTGAEEDEVLLALFELGIAGFAPKTSRSEIIEAAIRLVLAGGRYLPPRLAEIAISRSGGATPGAHLAPGPRLTERQTDVLRLSAQGRSNKEIARELDLSPATVKAHIAAGLAVLGAANRTEAVVRARELGLI